MEYKFILFYNGREYFDNYIIIYNTETKEWKCEEFLKTEFLGNFYIHEREYTIHGKKYQFLTSENAFQSAKCKRSIDIPRFQNIKPGDAFRLGRSVELVDGWDSKKVNIMENIIREKFSSPNMKEKLLETENIYLIEHIHRDSFWADGGNGKGRNQLGLSLMKVRAEYGGFGKPNIPTEIITKLYGVIRTF